MKTLRELPKGYERPADGSFSKPPKQIVSSGIPEPKKPTLNDIVSGIERRIKHFTVKIEPMGAPRMTRRDKWLKPRRSCVERYFAFRDKLRSEVGCVETVPDEIHTRFFIAMPNSWSKKKQIEMAGTPHRQRPDKDNLEKAVMDSLFVEDGAIWKGSQEKHWCKQGEERILISMIWQK